MAIKAVVFDMDGTLIDSRALVLGAMELTLASKNITVTRDQMVAVTGKPVHAMYKLLAPGHDSAELVTTHFENQEQFEGTVVHYENVHEILEALRARGLKLGVFTGFDQRCLDRLKQFDLLQYFDSIVDCSRYKAHKPNPEGLLLCIQELGVLPQETVYVGDGVTDMTAGLAAEVYQTVGITHGFTTREKLSTSGAQHTVDSLTELQTYLEGLQTK